ncbi:MAG: hypothetical protein V3V01_16710 [Acidimicrobiales bacterium]
MIAAWRLTHDADASHRSSEEPFAAAKKAHPAFRVTAISLLADHLIEQGFEVNWDQNIPGVRRFETFDVFGNRLEFLQ